MRDLIQLFIQFFKIGLFTFGGGMAMIPLIERTIVDEKKWLDKEEMLDCVAVSQSMPGIVAVNSATYVGNRLHGFKGALAATLGVIMPSFMIIIAVVLFLDKIGENHYVEGAMRGIKAAVCGLMITTCIRLGRQAMHDWFSWIAGIVAACLIVVFDITAVWVIIGAGAAGVLFLLLKRGGAR